MAYAVHDILAEGATAQEYADFADGELDECKFDSEEEFGAAVKESKLLTFHKQDLVRVKKKGASHVASIKKSGGRSRQEMSGPANADHIKVGRHAHSLSRLQHAKPDELAEPREQGKRHLEFACSLARLQIEQGGRILFEYPLAASEEPCLWKLRSIDGMRCVRCDQCQFGMTSVDSAVNVGPACKATGFMTNDEYTRRPRTDTVLVDTITFSCSAAERNPAKSITHGWWQRYCVPCDRAWEPRDAAKPREWWTQIDS